MLGVDQRINTRVHQDQGRRVRHHGVTRIYDEADAVRSDADEKPADDVEHVFGDLHLAVFYPRCDVIVLSTRHIQYVVCVSSDVAIDG